MGACNDNACHLRIVIEPRTYVVEHVYLYPSGLNFYLDIADLYARFGTDFIFPKTGECSCHSFYSIYHSFPLPTLHHYIGCQFYPLVSTTTYHHMNRTMKKREQYFADLFYSSPRTSSWTIATVTLADHTYYICDPCKMRSAKIIL